jgi:hypothetical protein
VIGRTALWFTAPYHRKPEVSRSGSGRSFQARSRLALYRGKQQRALPEPAPDAWASACTSGSGTLSPAKGRVGPKPRDAGNARTVDEVKPTRAGSGRRYLPGSPFNVPVVAAPVETYERRDLVTHDKYGLGSVVDVEGETAVLVDFRTHRMRVALPCAKLFKL